MIEIHTLQKRLEPQSKQSHVRVTPCEASNPHALSNIELMRPTIERPRATEVLRWRRSILGAAESSVEVRKILLWRQKQNSIAYWEVKKLT